MTEVRLLVLKIKLHITEDKYPRHNNTKYAQPYHSINKPIEGRIFRKEVVCRKHLHEHKDGTTKAQYTYDEVYQLIAVIALHQKNSQHQQCHIRKRRTR